MVTLRTGYGGSVPATLASVGRLVPDHDSSFLVPPWIDSPDREPDPPTNHLVQARSGLTSHFAAAAANAERRAWLARLGFLVVGSGTSDRAKALRTRFRRAEIRDAALAVVAAAIAVENAKAELQHRGVSAVKAQPWAPSGKKANSGSHAALIFTATGSAGPPGGWGADLWTLFSLRNLAAHGLLPGHQRDVLRGQYPELVPAQRALFAAENAAAAVDTAIVAVRAVGSGGPAVSPRRAIRAVARSIYRVRYREVVLHRETYGITE